MLLRLRQDIVIRKLVRKQGINIHAALRRFWKFDLWTNQKYIRDNSKVSTSLHSGMFFALGSFLLTCILGIFVWSSNFFSTEFPICSVTFDHNQKKGKPWHNNIFFRALTSKRLEQINLVKKEKTLPWVSAFESWSWHL